ncbi:chromosome transmission fidelity protein 8 homolog [Corticium candelabrum]|uniref:chromosome transmission fidelity protein 8 homolog n=1 Tax=Corticium candelabrum TaxID=121492 RepID=UPI002E270607|nr:chromosome transmission fidelity protein 8 homolog [Corticium candelabrum]
MVQIVVRMGADGSEWGLVELQGQLDTKAGVSLDELHIGDLHFDETGIAHMIIGHHLLTGKVATLEKPFAVISRKTDELKTSSEVAMETGDETTGNTEYTIVAMIRRKVVFKVRPKPIVSTFSSKIE